MKRILIGGIVSALVLAACSGSDVSSPSSLQLSSADTLQAVVLSAGDATAEDVNVMTASEASMDASTPAYDLIQASRPSFSTTATGADSVRYAFWAFAGGCTYASATGRFTCPDIVKNGLTLHRTLLGADTISRTRSMTATGLLGHETSRTWNGTGNRTDGGYANDTERTRTYHTTDATTFTNVVVNLPSSANPWPMSGTVTRQIAGSGTVVKNGVTRTFTISKIVTITFNS